MGPVPEPSALIYVWCDDFRERVSCPIQSRLDRAEIALRDFRDFLTGLAFQFPEDDDMPVLLRKLRATFFDDLSQMTLAIHVIRTRGRVLELKRPVFILRVLLHGLQEHPRIARTVCKLVLREVRRNGVNPRREFLRPVETMEMAIDADENFLHQIFRFLAITDGPVHEIKK